MEARTIMYIGPKTRKDDRVNGDLGRVWPGTGTTVEAIPATQAARLVAHRDEYLDVTGKSQQELASLAQKAIADCAEMKREARAKGQASAAGTVLEYATEDELRAELQRRSDQQTLRDITVESPGLSDADEMLVTTTEQQRQDQSVLAQKVPQAIETVLEKGNPDLLDNEGFPTKEALEEALAFTLTEDDYTAAREAV